MDKKWIETVSKLQTYEISPFEINKSIIEFAKAILSIDATLTILADPVLSKDLRKSIKEAEEGRLIPFEKVEEDQDDLDFIDESLPPSMQS